MNSIYDLKQDQEEFTLQSSVETEKNAEKKKGFSLKDRISQALSKNINGFLFLINVF